MNVQMFEKAEMTVDWAVQNMKGLSVKSYGDPFQIFGTAVQRTVKARFIFLWDTMKRKSRMGALGGIRCI